MKKYKKEVLKVLEDREKSLKRRIKYLSEDLEKEKVELEVITRCIKQIKNE